MSVFPARLEKIQRSALQVSETLTSLGIMGAQFRTRLRPVEHRRNFVSSGLGGPAIDPPLYEKVGASRAAQVIFHSPARISSAV